MNFESKLPFASIYQIPASEQYLYTNLNLLPLFSLHIFLPYSEIVFFPIQYKI